MSIDTYLQDIRFGLRTIARKPGVSAVIILTLALGIGANTAIFSVIRSVLLKPLPFHEADRLVHIWENYPKGSRYRWGSDQGYIIVRPGTYSGWKAQSTSFESMASYGWRSVAITSGGDASVLHAHEVDEAFFSTLGVKPELGRVFQPSDFQSADERIVILSHTLWRDRFGADRGLIGKSVELDGAAYNVIGVMPDGFYPTRWETPKLWLPLTMDPALKQSRVTWKLFTFARLKPGVTFDQAQTEMDVISNRLTAAYPDQYDNMCAVLTPVTGYLFSQYEKLFYTLLGAVGLVLLIACANVANLLLARAAEREREFALRAAVGASRWRVVRQLLTESLLLSGTGAVLGTALAFAAIPGILALLPASSRVPRIGESTLDWQVPAFTLGVSLIAGVLFGLVPALHASRPDLNSSLKEGGRTGSAGAGTRRTGNVLVVAEMAVSLVLLLAAGVLMESFLRLLKTDPGFHPGHVLAVAFGVPAQRYGKYESGGANPARARLFDEMERKLSATPGVASATVTMSLPLRHGPNPWSMHIVGKAAPPADSKGYGGAARNKQTGLYNHGAVSLQRVTPGYFETFGIRLVRGRALDWRDAANAPMVAVINETNARKYFGADDPIGKTIVIDMTSYFPRMTVVGVVADSRLNALDKEVIPEVFWPMAQLPAPGGWAAVRTTGDPSEVANAVRGALRELDPALAITEVITMDHVVSESVWRQRLTAVLLGFFALLSAVLAFAGIYGVFSYMVNRRSKEIGVRMALGAGRANILMMILGSGIKLAGIGIAIGIGIALVGRRALSSQITGIQNADPFVVTGVSLALLVVAVLACLLPAARATHVDPAIALREQ